ncbi:MAG: RDD family protein [Bacteroidota bacterium]|nr:RDD family protein [Bacteroidota bacterium]
MDQIQINTTQNVALGYEPAGVGYRILAGLLDQVFVIVYTILIYWFFFTFVLSRNYYTDESDHSDSYNAIMVGLMTLFLVPAGLYHLLCETFLNGQSFGKKIVQIKVVKIDGTQPGFGSYLIRSMLRLMDVTLISPTIGIICIAATEKSQRLGDIAAGTTVIKLNTNLSIRDTILYQQRPEYKIVYEQVALLNDKEANLIKEVLEFCEKQEQPQHLKQLSDKLKTKLGIENSEQNDLEFLHTILNDYSHYRFEN